MGGILVVLLRLSMAATQDRLVAPAEQYRGLLKESGEAAQANWKATPDEERRQAAEKCGDVKLSFGGTVGDNAKLELFAIRHLAVGKEAADIEGPGQSVFMAFVSGPFFRTSLNLMSTQVEPCPPNSPT